MRRKDIRKKAFAKIMSPKCPKCKKYDADIEHDVIPTFLSTMGDFLKLINGTLKIDVYTCRNCGTVWDSRGRIRSEK